MKTNLPLMDYNRSMYDPNELSVAEKTFAISVAQGESLASAVRKAYPHLTELSTPSYIYKKASNLVRKGKIILEIQNQKKMLDEVASKAVGRLNQLVDSKKEYIALDASKFAIEQAHGKATQKLEQRSAHVLVTYNLGGDDVPPVPQEILDQLAAVK